MKGFLIQIVYQIHIFYCIYSNSILNLPRFIKMMRKSQGINQPQNNQSFATNRIQNPQYIHTYHIPQPTVSPHTNYANVNLSLNQAAHHVSSTPKQYQNSVIRTSRTAGFGAAQSSGGFGSRGQYIQMQSFQRKPQQIQADFQRVITKPVQRPQPIRQSQFIQQRKHISSHAVSQSQLQGIRQKRSLTPQLQRILNKPVYVPNQNGGTTIKTLIGGHQVIHSEYANTGYVQSKYNKNFEEYRVPNPTRQEIQGSNHTISQQERRETQRITHMDSRVQGQVQAPPRKIVKVDHVPFMRRYYQWEQREVVNVVYVPVQRYIEDFYTVEHFVEYQPVAREQMVIQYLPQERINYRVEYQMVQKKIVHMPTNEQMTDLKNFSEEDRIALMQEKGYHNSINIVSKQESWKPQTHYVTSQVPSYKIEIEPQFSIEQRESRYKHVREEPVNYTQDHRASNQGSRVLIQNRDSNLRKSSNKQIKQENTFVINNTQQSKISQKSNKMNPFEKISSNQQNNEPVFVLQ